MIFLLLGIIFCCTEKGIRHILEKGLYHFPTPLKDFNTVKKNTSFLYDS